MMRILLIICLATQCITLAFSQGCAGLTADAGPDVFSCDPSMPPQLQGSYTGVPDKFSWMPTTYLSDPNALDPFVNAPAGKYTYTLKVESIGTMDFINNGNFESGNSGFTHEYNYGVPGGTFGPGWLSVGTNPLGYNGSWGPCGDHTSGSGNQLIVDGHTNANAKVWCQTVNLTVGRSYAFRFFVQSVFPSNPPNLSASANNASFGNIQGAGVCDWQMFEECFTATSSSVEICIRETTGVGFGNDFAIDDISLFEKCMDEDEVVVEIVDLKAVINIPVLPKCASDIFDLNAIGSSVGPNISYEWTSIGGKIVSSNGLTAKAQGGGTYKLKVIYRNGNVMCEQEAEIEVDPSEDLEAILEVEGIANCNLDTISLKTTVFNGGNNFSYFWIPSNKIIKGQNESTAYVVESGIYKVVIKDKDSGCETEIQEVVVSDTLKPQFSLQGDTLINCIVDTAQLTSSPYDTTRFSYEWIFPDLSSLKNKNQIQTPDSGLYTLKVYDKANKCFSEKFWLIQLDTSQPRFELGADGIIDCSLPEFTITRAGNQFPDSSDYTWKIPGGMQVNERLFVSKQIRDSGWVVLNILNRMNGCTAADSLYVSDLRVLPFVNAGPDDTLNCTQTQIQLGGIGKTDSTTIIWTTQNGNILMGSGSLTPLVDSSGWYYLSITDTTNHCMALDSVFVLSDFMKPFISLGPDLIFTCADTLKVLDGSASSQGFKFLYNWSTGSGSILSGQGSLMLTVNAPGTYTLNVIDTTNGCSDTASIEVKPDFSAPSGNILQADTLTCLRNNVRLTANASSPVGNAIRYQWIADAGQNINLSNTLGPEVQEPGTYTLIIFDEVNGCSTRVSVVVPIDTLAPTAIAGPDLVWNCASTSLQLNGGQSTGNHPLLFQWSTQDGMITTNRNRAQITTSAPGKYILFIIDSVSHCQNFDTLNIVADTIKPVAFISLPDTLTCLQSDVILDGSLSSSGSRLNFNWFTSNGQLSGPSDLNTSTAAKTGTYTLIIRDTLNFCADTQSITVIENKIKPILSKSGNTQLNCSSLSTQLLASIQNPSGFDDFSWTTPMGQINGNPKNDSVQVSRPGWYFVQVTNLENGCSNKDSILVTQINDLRVDAGLTSTLTCKIQSIDLMGAIFSGSGTEQIIWTTANGNISGNPQNANIRIDKPGTYYFRAYNPNNGCDALDSVVITENTNYPTAADLLIEPLRCPGDLWTVNINSISGGESPLIIEFEGRQIFGQTLQGSQPGTYQILITDNNGCELRKDFNILPALGISMNLTPFVKINSGESYLLQPVFSIPNDSIGSINWSPAQFLSCTDCLNPIAQNVTNDIEYFCTVTDKKGCTTSARIKIEVIKRNIWIPNVFSPNGDQINDFFYPHIEEESFNQIKLFQIFDRWGNMLFEKTSIAPDQIRMGWDGSHQGDKVMPGVYIYVIQLEWKNGELQVFSGDLTLIR
ncbi:MAG: gliding motility-associated C-terminal domain-containing protein [Saprospiraceae bacterium]|nr:gliding motility-associated C-terminal domain-containing protein [Saprospiraceae bacterium]